MDEAELFLKLQEKIDEKDTNCTICLSTKFQYRTIIYSCFHQFCGLCLFQWTQNGNDSCPVCRTEMSKIFFNVQTPTAYKTLDYNLYTVDGRFWRSQLIRKYYSYVILEMLKNSESPQISTKRINFDMISSFSNIFKENDADKKELHFSLFCFNEKYLPLISGEERSFSLKNFHDHPEYRDRLTSFLFAYLDPFDPFAIVNHNLLVYDINNSLRYSNNFDEFLLDFKLYFLKISELITPFLPYNFTKRLEYEFFTFALSTYDDYFEFVRRTDYVLLDDFNRDYEKLITSVRRSDGRDRVDRTMDDVMPNPIQNSIRVSPKQIHEFRRYIRLGLSSDHWFKHLVKYIVNKSIPGKQSILNHSAFKYLEPFFQRIIRIRGIIDLQSSIHEKQLLRLLVHENKSNI